MTNVHDVAVLHDVVFAFEAEGAFGAGVGFGASFEKLVPANGFGADEMFFEIGVDRPGSFLRTGIGGDLPGAAFVFSGGEKRDDAEQAVRRAYEARETAFFQPVTGKKFGSVSIAHLRELGFDFAANGGGGRVRSGCDFGQLIFA